MLIPATAARYGDPGVFKTPHHPDYYRDGDKLMTKVAAATSAAPTYLQPVIQDEYTLLDGGIWANNPTLMGLLEALTCFNLNRDNIKALSIGCGQNGFQINKAQTAGAGQWRGRGIMESEKVPPAKQRRQQPPQGSPVAPSHLKTAARAGQRLPLLPRSKSPAAATPVPSAAPDKSTSRPGR